MVLKLAYEIFPWFPGFRIYSMAKNENPEIMETNRKLSKLEAPIVKGTHY